MEVNAVLLTSYDPFTREFDRLAQRVFGTTNGGARRSVIPMDSIRRKDEVELRFDLPGIDPESIEDAVDSEKIDAAYAGGVLTVRLPLLEKAQPRKVEIHTDGQKEIAA